MPQKFLHGLYIFAIGLEKRRIGVAECMPTDPALNARRFHRRLQMPTIRCPRPIGLHPIADRWGE